MVAPAEKHAHSALRHRARIRVQGGHGRGSLDDVLPQAIGQALSPERERSAGAAWAAAVAHQEAARKAAADHAVLRWRCHYVGRSRPTAQSARPARPRW